MEYKFDNDFRFKNLPDESTPINADNLNKALDNTSWLKSQLDGTIEPMSGSSIEINDSAEAMLNKLEIEGKSTQDGEPSPENPVEIKSVGYTNLFDSDRYYREYSELDNNCVSKIIEDGVEYFNINYSPSASRNYKFMQGEFKPDTQYIITFKGKNATKGVISNASFQMYYTDRSTSGWVNVSTDNEQEYSIKSSAQKTVDYITVNGSGAHRFLARDICLYESSTLKPYIPFGKYGIVLNISNDTETKTTTFVLNEPLRSLPTGVKDLLYIKNGRLFVERNVGNVSFTGTESWATGNPQSSVLNSYRAYLPINNAKIGSLNEKIFCSHFVYGSTRNEANVCQFATNNNNFHITIANVSDINSFKSVLMQQNENGTPVELVYSLEKSVTEDLGEIEMPSTFKDKSTITTTDELEPTINLEYVKDTILTSYVEKRLINLMK